MDNRSNLAEAGLAVGQSGDFARQDEADDSLFYAQERMVSHLDRTALDTVERIIGSLVVEKDPVILDLMASWDSHLPPSLRAGRVVGLGLNQGELAANRALDECVIHDLNQDPSLPFADASFDVVLNTVSVDYLVRPVEVFAEAARVLKPGGLHLVIFSNRWFEPKVTHIWREAGETERPLLVEDWLRAAGGFAEARAFVSKNKPRPQDDKYAHLNIPSDPVYAVFADRLGGDPARPPRPLPGADRARRPKRDLKALAAQVAKDHACPYCGQQLKKWEIPQTPFTEWDIDYMYVCFNDVCPYLVGGWEEMGRQGNLGSSYRLMFNPQSQTLMPMAVPSLSTAKDGIVDE
ncbi:methyltransferase [Desulfocarbo indianensis]|nr:methyltransferase [Desulfocarbo indianensis]